MTKSYEELLTEIESLREQAERVRAKEVTEVIERMKVAIAVYGITAAELGFDLWSAAGPEGVDVRRSAAGRVRYANAVGQVWGGRGPRPRWVKEHLAAGGSLDDIRVGADARSRSPSGAAAARDGSGKRHGAGSKSEPKFRNEQGETWGGRGPRPLWLRRSLEQGHSLADFEVR